MPVWAPWVRAQPPAQPTSPASQPAQGLHEHALPAYVLQYDVPPPEDPCKTPLLGILHDLTVTGDNLSGCQGDVNLHLHPVYKDGGADDFFEGGKKW